MYHRLARDVQMPLMRRIERTAKDSDAPPPRQVF
jgi:hypothetical protein